MNDRLIPLSKLSALRKKYRNKRIVLLGGGFDILHTGHVRQIAWAKSQGDVLVVHVTGDRRFKEKKQRKPLLLEKERAAIISALRAVDHVFTYNGRHYDKKILASLAPDILVFHKEAFSKAIANALKEMHFEGDVRVSTFKKNHSSSKLREKGGQKK